jgi:hypothetical protein
VLRPIHERLMAAFAALDSFETAPKKGYVSLRRKKLFATVGPTTRTRVDVGLTMKGVPATELLIDDDLIGLGPAGLRGRGLRDRHRLGQRRRGGRDG